MSTVILNLFHEKIIAVFVYHFTASLSFLGNCSLELFLTFISYKPLARRIGMRTFQEGNFNVFIVRGPQRLVRAKGHVEAATQNKKSCMSKCSSNLRIFIE